MRRLVGLALCLVAVMPTAHAAPLPETLRSAGVTAAQWDEIETETRRLAERAGVSERALSAIAVHVGIAAAMDRPGLSTRRIVAGVEQSLERLRELEERLRALEQTLAHIREARAAVDAGELERALEILASGRASARQGVRDAQIREAQLIGTEAGVRRLRFEFGQAAALYREAAEAAPASASEVRWGLLILEAETLRDYALFASWRVSRFTVVLGQLETWCADCPNNASSLTARRQHDIARDLARQTLGRSVAALEQAEAVLGEAPNRLNSARTQVELAETLLEATSFGDWEAASRGVIAVRSALQTIGLDEQRDLWARAQWLRGRLNETVGQTGEAVDAYRALVEAAPNEAGSTRWRHALRSWVGFRSQEGTSDALQNALSILDQQAPRDPGVSEWAAQERARIVERLGRLSAAP